MTYRKINVALIVFLAGMPAFAGNTGKNLLKGVDAALSRQALRQLPSKASYHPVFGYIRPNLNLPVEEKLPLTPFTSVKELGHNEGRLIQTRPVLQPTQPSGFVRLKDLSDAELTQAIYLWRVANPDHTLLVGMYPQYLFDMAQNRYNKAFSYYATHGGLNEIEQLPNLLFLKRLTQVDAPVSYAQLYEETRQYPKHVTLNKFGFPVKTPEAGRADTLDNYLLLANKQEMGTFNNSARDYTPFVLTPQEQAAADKLLALRREGEKLSANPSVREVLELAYNRLETHTIKYTQVNQANLNFSAYPDYKNTELYRLVEGMIAGQKPLVADYYGHRVLTNTDLTHLMVLHAIMGGVDLTDAHAINRTLDAFVELCAEVDSKDIHAAEHLLILQQNLRVAFYPLMYHAFARGRQTSYTSGGEWQWGTLANKSWSLLQDSMRLRELIGVNSSVCD